MITAVVTAPIPKGLTREKYFENIKKTAERFRTVPGLIRKNFLVDFDSGVGGGVYLWETREAAEACYRGVWRDNFKASFGVDPTIQFFDSMVIVDNEQSDIKIAA